MKNCHISLFKNFLPMWLKNASPYIARFHKNTHILLLDCSNGLFGLFFLGLLPSRNLINLREAMYRWVYEDLIWELHLAETPCQKRWAVVQCWSREWNQIEPSEHRPFEIQSKMVKLPRWQNHCFASSFLTIRPEFALWVTSLVGFWE